MLKNSLLDSSHMAYMYFMCTYMYLCNELFKGVSKSKVCGIYLGPPRHAHCLSIKRACLFVSEMYAPGLCS